MHIATTFQPAEALRGPFADVPKFIQCSVTRPMGGIVVYEAPFVNHPAGENEPAQVVISNQ